MGSINMYTDLMDFLSTNRYVQKLVTTESSKFIVAAKIIASFFISIVAGFNLVKYLCNKHMCKNSPKVWKLTLAVFFVPTTLFAVLNFLVMMQILDRFVSDSCGFGLVLGILVKIYAKPAGANTVKLIVQQIRAKPIEIWLESKAMTVGEVRNKIAKDLNIVPATRISIESGKGSFLEDFKQPFFAGMDTNAVVSTDFFGFTTTSCYICIAAAEEIHRTSSFVGEGALTEKKKSYFKSLIARAQIKFNEEVTMNAKTPQSSQSSSFSICYCEKFMAASPVSTHFHILQTLKLRQWDESEQKSESGETHVSALPTSGTKGGTPKTTKPQGKMLMSIFNRKKDETGRAIYNGDTVVVECENKYLSVTRGWWMAWNSSEPRRSGVFVIEIVERAPKSALNEQLKGQLEYFKSQLGATTGSKAPKEEDNILHPGDLFRLRSVKFPEFELGVTSVKVRDEYCYMGLRKSADKGGDSSGAEWCTEVLFSVKPQSLTNEMFTMSGRQAATGQGSPPPRSPRSQK